MLMWLVSKYYFKQINFKKIFSFCASSQCAKSLNIDVAPAKNCKNTRTTIDILKKYGDETDAIEISFVPSIAMGGVSQEYS